MNEDGTHRGEAAGDKEPTEQKHLIPAERMRTSKNENPIAQQPQAPAPQKPTGWKRFLNWISTMESGTASERVIALFTVVIALIGIGQYLVFQKQLDVFGKQLSEMQGAGKQTDRLIEADNRIAAAMEGSVSQARAAFEAANKQAILSQRAWIAIDLKINRPEDERGKPKPSFIVGQKLDIRITVKNTGRTPALNVKTMMFREPVREKDGIFPAPSFRYNPRKWVAGGNLTPDGDIFSDFVSDFTDEDYRLIFTDTVRVFVHGRVEYDDVFGTHHWRNFCGQLLSGGAFSICPYNNEMDRN